ncbi:MAG: DUF2059 domain-containing protein [Marinosulfonomonas sp.]
MARRFFAALTFILMATQASAGSNAAVATLTDALGLPEILDIMRTEGIDYGDELALDMFPDRAGDSWRAKVTKIYDADRMSDIAIATMADELGDADIAAMTAFFTGDLGKRIVGLEISARRALMDEAIEEASKEHVAQMFQDGDERISLLEDFVSANDLLESNVVGALNSNYAFYTGLADGGALPEEMTESEMLREVWSQEEDIRADTGDWLFAFLALAYQPLTDEELIQYIEFSTTAEGKALNQSLFVGFDAMFVEISRGLGFAAAGMLAGEDI